MQPPFWKFTSMDEHDDIIDWITLTTSKNIKILGKSSQIQR